MFFLWLLLIPAAVYFYRMFDRNAGTHPCAYSAHASEPKGDKALEILNERYVKGEISQEEYRMKKEDLMKQP